VPIPVVGETLGEITRGEGVPPVPIGAAAEPPIGAAAEPPIGAAAEPPIGAAAEPPIGAPAALVGLLTTPPAPNAQLEDTASAIAVTIVVVFMTSVSLFMVEDKDCRRMGFPIEPIKFLLPQHRLSRPISIAVATWSRVADGSIKLPRPTESIASRDPQGVDAS
jgi:hypothetical protein